MVGVICWWGTSCGHYRRRAAGARALRLHRASLGPSPIRLQLCPADSTEPVLGRITFSAAPTLLRLPCDHSPLFRATLRLHRRPTKAAELIFQLVGLSAR